MYVQQTSATCIDRVKSRNGVDPKRTRLLREILLYFYDVLRVNINCFLCHKAIHLTTNATNKVELNFDPCPYLIKYCVRKQLTD